jgi:DNA-binding PadR family transcriptional regulator
MGRRATASDGFGSEVVLGLLSEKPSSYYQLDCLLSQRFPSFDYTKGMAGTTVKRLVRHGYARPVADMRVAAGALASRDDGPLVFEATPAGVERFREWMWSSVVIPPVREELHAKIALCQPNDLPRMIALVRNAEIVCVGKLQDLNRELQARRVDTDPEQWSMRMDLVVSTGDQAWWESRISWLQRVHLFLEKEWQLYQAQSHARPVLRRLA